MIWWCVYVIFICPTISAFLRIMSSDPFALIWRKSVWGWAVGKKSDVRRCATSCRFAGNPLFQTPKHQTHHVSPYPPLLRASRRGETNFPDSQLGESRGRGQLPGQIKWHCNIRQTCRVKNWRPSSLEANSVNTRRGTNLLRGVRFPQGEGGGGGKFPSVQLRHVEAAEVREVHPVVAGQTLPKRKTHTRLNYCLNDRPLSYVQTNVNTKTNVAS